MISIADSAEIDEVIQVTFGFLLLRRTDAEYQWRLQGATAAKEPRLRKYGARVEQTSINSRALHTCGMDDILTEFIARSGADPAFAHDLLDSFGWSLEEALSAYESFKSTDTVQYETDFGPDPHLISHPPNMAGEPPPHTHTPHTSTDVNDLLRTLDIDPASEERKKEEEEGEEEGLADLDESITSRKARLRKQRQNRGRGLSYVAEDVVDNFKKVAVSRQRASSIAEEEEVIEDRFFQHSFLYPDFSGEPADLCEFIRGDLLETSHLRALERTGRLNWWTATGKLPRLEPLATSGDGNCLLHAASLYMWGFHDRELILRTALHRLLTKGVEKEGIQRRWRYQTGFRNEEAGGLTFSEEEWDFEWAEIVRIATSKPRRAPATASLRRYSSLRLSYEYLEEVHIFALAHVIRRPVIIISDRVLRNISGEDIAPIYFGGIYLPLEISPSQCYKSPMVLAYDASHFSALVANEDKGSDKKVPKFKFDRMSGRKDNVIPLVTADGALLPVQFVVDPSKSTVDERWAKGEFTPEEFPQDITHLLESYLNIRWIQLKLSAAQQAGEATPPSQAGEPPPPPRSAGGEEDYDHLWPIQVPKVRFPVAVISQEAQPIYQKDIIEKYLKHVKVKFEEDRERRQKMAEERARMEEEKKMRRPVPCEGKGCAMFGTPATNNLCSVCYQKSQTPLASTGDGADQSPPTCSSPGEDSADYPPPYDVMVTTTRDEHYQFNPASVGQLGRQYSAPPTSTRSTHTGGDGSQQPSSLPSETAGAAQSRLSPAHQLSGSGSDGTNGTMQEPQRLPSPKTSPSKSRKKGSSDNGSPKSKRPGWVKKLDKLVPKSKRSSNSNGGSSSATSGYTRDNIQPVRFESEEAAVAGVKGTKCVSAGCEFWGNASTGGYCSKCHKIREEEEEDSHVTLV